MPTPPETPIHWYRALLRLLPRDVRERFGLDMESVLRHRLARAGRGPVRVAVVGRAIADVALHALALRLENRGGWRMGTLLRDMRDGLRTALGAPGVALVTVLTLGLGIGASTATYSVVHAVLLQDLPVEDQDRLVFVWPGVNANKAVTLRAAERVSSLSHVSGMSFWTLTLTGEGEPREVGAMLVQPGYFEMLGVRPVHGRVFRTDEELPGAADVVVLSYDFWVSAFGGDPAVLDRVIDLGGAEYDRRRVIGIMPPRVNEIISEVDVWIPLEGDPALGLAEDDSWYVNHRMARLAPGATLEQASAEVRSYAREVVEELPSIFEAEEASSARVEPVRAWLTRDVRTSVWVALGAVSLVLLIGCFNVANLLLARGDARARDLAVRAALGAGRLRITRMLLAETAVLGLAGGTLGLLVGSALIRVVVRLAPETLTGGGAIAMSGGVVAFALLATAVATLGAGLVPALRVGRANATAALGGGARGAGGRQAGRLTPALVASQVALAVVVTVGSGLMLRSLTTLLAVDPGIDAEGVLAFKATPPAGRYPDGVAFLTFYDQVSEAVGALPGIESLGGIHILPGTPNNWSFPTFPDDYTIAAGTPNPSVNFRAVRGDYFATTGMTIESGRALADGDRADGEPVVVVNDAFVREFWPDGRALDRTLAIFSPSGTRYRVVGVVGDVRQHELQAEPRAEMYFSHAQVPWDQMSLWLVARVQADDPLTLARAVEDAVWSVDPDVPVTGTARLSDVIGESARTTRFLTVLLGSFGVLALALCAVGVFGVASYTGNRRRPEFGVRLALGSSRASVVRSAMARSLGPVAVGLAAGLGAAAAVSRLLSSALYEVRPLDPVTFTAVPVVLALVGLAAAMAPAWRASRVDPVRVLGAE